MRRAHRPLLVISACVAMLALAACTPAEPGGLAGRVAPIVDAPLEGWTVEAWTLGADDPVLLDSADVDDDGGFSLDVEDAAGKVLFVEARASDDESSPTLSVVVPDAASIDALTLNERTTVAAGYALAGFFDGDAVSGPNPGLPNAAATAANLADPATGAYAEVLTSAPNGSETSTVDAFTSLANMLGACLLEQAACDDLYESATADDVVPSSATAAFAAVAQDPSANVEALFGLATVTSADRPGLTEAPAAWTLALRFNGDGESLAGPGNFVVDPEGNLWVNNNYDYNADAQTPVCGSDEMFEFSPTGELIGTYAGAGLSGSGFGIDFTHQGELWLSNFGFAAPAPGCPEDQQPPHNSMSLFNADHDGVSPDAGFTQGDLSWPQGIEVVADDSVWIANCGNNTVALYPEGDPDQAVNLGGFGLEAPFAIVDNGQLLFVTGTVNDTVAVINPDGTAAAGSPLTGSFAQPMGVAADAEGNVWVANSGGITLPCPARSPQGRGTPSVTMISPDGTEMTGPFTGGGATLPWGISTDGDGNVWVANFSEMRVSHFCGANAETCPRGLQTGDAISPDGTGYFFDGLERSTGVIVDTAGNVWVTNNWKEDAAQTNPGGHEIVAFIGAAAPVEVPAFD